MKLSRTTIRYKLAVASHLGIVPNLFTNYHFNDDRFDNPEKYISTDKCKFWVDLFLYYVFQTILVILAFSTIALHLIVAPIFSIFAMLYDLDLFLATNDDSAILFIGFVILGLYLMIALSLLGSVCLSKFNELTHINYRKSFFMDKWDKLMSWKESKCTKIEFED